MSELPWWRVGARVELRKAHACGGLRWRITRLGTDIGLECEQCGRRLLLTRDEFDRRLRGTVGEQG